MDKALIASGAEWYTEDRIRWKRAKRSGREEEGC